MSLGIFPEHSRNRVQSAGDRIRRGTATHEDMAVLENWRASHAHVINTFQANLRRRTRGTGILVGQRLKRRVTIVDKLSRQAGMNLARMHDIAGCRVIFSNTKELLEFRAELIKSRAQHERLTAERDQFNYIERPKSSGYRGIHDVYRYHSYAKAADKWSGLLVEIQFRTRAQHAWATAVEIADLLTRSRGKFAEADDDYQHFFKVCSEIIARTTENSNSCFPEMSDSDLTKAFEAANKSTNLLEILRRTNQVSTDLSEKFFKKKLNTILTYPYEGGTMLRVYSFDDTRKAIERYEELEKELEGKADVVLVRAEDANSLMKVFQNYFTDARDFVRYVTRGVDTLNKSKTTKTKIRTKPRAKLKSGE